MTIRNLLDKLEDGTTKINVIDKYGEVLYMGVWFVEIDNVLFSKKIKRLEVKDYLLNIFI